MERKVCFILDASSQWGRWTPVPRPFPHPPDTQWARASVGRGRGLRADRAQSALTVILKLVIGGLTSIILIVLSTVGSDSKESVCSAGDLGSVPGLGRSPGGGDGNVLQ